MSRVNPLPAVTLAGVVVRQDAAAVAANAAVVLDAIDVTWGRRKLTDHHEPQAATFSLLDDQGTWAGVDLIGKPVELSWTDPASGYSRRFFRGRVSDVAMTPRTPHTSGPRKGWWRGARLDITAAGTLAELGNVFTGTEAWPDESMATRWGRLRALVAPGIVADIVTRSGWANGPVAARNVNGTDVLSLARALCDSQAADRLAYDPETNRVTYVGRPSFITTRRAYLSRNLAQNPSGVRIACPSNTPAGPMIDGGELSSSDGKLTKTVENRVTRLTYTYFVGGVQQSFTILLPDLEASNGRREATFTSEYRQQDWADQTAHLWFDSLIFESNAYAPPPVTYEAGRFGGFPSLSIAQLMVGGYEASDSDPALVNYLGQVLYFAGTPWPRLKVPPNLHVMGGTIRYQAARGGWFPDLYLQPVDAKLSSAVGGAPTELGADELVLTDGTEFTWDELDGAITWNDLIYVSRN